MRPDAGGDSDGVIYGGSSEPLADGQSFPKSPRVGERTNNMKEKRFFPEKGLLMLSGAAFLLLIVPAWVPGFVWCGVAADDTEQRRYYFDKTNHRNGKSDWYPAG